MPPPSTNADPQKNAAAAAGEEEAAAAAKPHPLLRDEREGMHPVALLTSFRGARGERIRHTVHEGALRLPAHCLRQEEAADAWREAVKKGKKRYALPSLEAGVTRPSCSANGYVVTTVQREETVQEFVNTVDGTLQKRTLYSMVASNRTVVPERRIRGGGGDGGGDDVEGVDGGEKDKDTAAPDSINNNTNKDAPPAVASETANAMDVDVEKPAAVAPAANATKPAGTEKQVVIPTGSNPQPSETPVTTETAKEGLAATALATAAPPPAAATKLVEEVTPQQIAAAAAAPPTKTGAVTSTTATEHAASAGAAPTVPAAAAVSKPPAPAPAPVAPTGAVKPAVVASNMAPSATTERALPAAPTRSDTMVAPSSAPTPAPSQAPTPAFQPLAPARLATAAAAAAPVPAVADTTVAAPVPAPAAAAAASTTTTTKANPPPVAAQPVSVAAAPPASTVASAPAQPVAAPISSTTGTSTTQPAAPVATAAVRPAPVAANVPSGAAPGTKAVPVAASASSNAAAASGAPAPVPANAEETTSSAEATKKPEEVTKSAEPPKPPPEPRVLPLDQEPTPQWHQHKPGDNDEMQVESASQTPKPAWYKADSAAAIERTLLPEWFDGSAAHRTPATYVQAREAVLKMAATLGHNRFITATLVRRTVPGDAGSLIRLHAFLTAHHLLNADAVNDSMPTPAAFFSTAATKKRSASSITAIENRVLMEAVVEQANKRMKMDNDDDDTAIDWEAVAEQVGNGATAGDCERQFLALPLEEESEAQQRADAQREGSITPDPTTTAVSSAATAATKQQIQQGFLNSLIDRTDPAILRRVTQAALDATISENNDNVVSTASVAQAQRAATVGLVARQALETSLQQEAGVARLLSEIVDLRMQKLENRLAMLDDCEALLDAERLALELERRDLYTARCRHWFGGT